MRGTGRAVATAAATFAAVATPALGERAASSPLRISIDPYADSVGQHETAVEPDGISFGDTVIAAFQVGRTRSAGASGIGWASSHDGGSTWTSGVLPALTLHGSPSGPYTRATDPAVAYDRVHGVWLISVLALQDTPRGELLSALVTSRSGDGLSWSAPVVTSPIDSHFAHDKNWIVCDNGAGSRLRGSCYAVWTAVSGNLTILGVSASTDGGLSWEPARTFASISGSGWQPLVRPDGTLVVVYVTSRAVLAVRSTDGGRSFGLPVTVTALADSPTPGVRAPALPSAEVDGRGRIVAAWPDCRFRSGCGRTAPNDVVYSSSADGIRWSRVRRVPTGADLDGLPHLVVGLAVDSSTAGARARLGITFHVLTPRGCTADCRIAPYFVSSSDAGRGWSAPEQLAAPQPVTSFPLANDVRFVGDYTSTSFVGGGTAVPFFASASSPFDGRYHQGIYAATVPPQLSLPVFQAGRVVVVPRQPRKRVTTAVRITGVTKDASVECRTADRRLRLLSQRVSRASATCVWRILAARRGQLLRGTLIVTTPEADVTRRFAFRAAYR